MKSIRVVAFDCDGVMFDTVESNTVYYNHVLKHFGKPDMTPKQFACVHMHTAEESIDYLFQGSESLQAAQAFRRQMDYLSFIQYMKIEPYLKPLLERLRPHFKTAVATNRTDTMGHVLKEHGLEDLFDFVVTAGDVDHPKPHPEPLLKIVDHFEIAPRNLIYIGDSKLDEQAARAARVPLVAYNNRSLDAEYHIASLKEVGEILHLRGSSTLAAP